jgi:hypothetical protein
MAHETGEAIDARACLVAWALGEVGEQDPNKYFRVCAPQFADRGAEHSVSWCGVFCLAGMRAVGLCSWDWSSRASEPGFVWRLRITAFPERGDIMVKRKGADGVRDLWHHAIVKAPPVGGFVETIDGNVLIAPREGVAERRRPVESPALMTFYSIATLLRDP